MAPIPHAVNVHRNSKGFGNMSRMQLLDWVNAVLCANFTRFEEMRTGAAYCQLMDILFPGCVPLNRVKFRTNIEYDFFTNMRLFQNALVKVNVDRNFPIERMMAGSIQENFEFLQWFWKFFRANYNRPSWENYDALAERNHQLIGYGPPIRRVSKKL